MFAKLSLKAIPLLLLLIALSSLPGRAADAGSAAPASDADPRTVLAGEILELAYSPSTLRDSFSGFLAPALDAMKREGMPDEARTEVRKAFLEWFNQEIKWEEIKPQLVQIYAKDFSEPELRALLTFLDKPMGQRVMAKLPLVMQDGALAGQQYFMSKQDSLNAKLQPIMEKYKGKTAPGN